MARTTGRRDGRGARWALGAVVAFALVVTVVLHRRVLADAPWAFWLPTVAGLAYGGVLWTFAARRSTTWLWNTVAAGWLVVFWVLLGTRVVSGPAWFIAVMIGAVGARAVIPERTPRGRGRGGRPVGRP